MKRNKEFIAIAIVIIALIFVNFEVGTISHAMEETTSGTGTVVAGMDIYDFNMMTVGILSAAIIFLIVRYIIEKKKTLKM